MEFDHQQMAGASFGKPITAESQGFGMPLLRWLPGISPVQKLPRGAPSFWFLYLVLLIYFQLPAHLQSCATEQHMLLLSQAGSAGKSERGAGAASHGSMGIGNTWHSTAQEVPPVTAALVKKHRSKFKPIAKRRDPFWGELLTSRWRGKPFTAEHGVPAIELNRSEDLPWDNRVWSPCYIPSSWVSMAKLTVKGLLQHHNW